MVNNRAAEKKHLTLKTQNQQTDLIKRKNMEIELNGLKETIPDNMSINALIELFKEGDPHLIVEVNNRYIFPKNYKTTMIMENDQIEFINPNLGG